VTKLQEISLTATVAASLLVLRMIDSKLI